MITDIKKWHYLAVKTFPELHIEIEITSNHVGDFCCLNYFHLFKIKK